jgi:hypothetical protein
MRKFVFYLILVVFVLVGTLFFAEIAATVYYVVREGKYVSPRARFAAERNAYVEGAQAQTTACSYGDSLIVHPYLAFVQTNLGSCGVPYANSKALIGKEFPDKQRARLGVVLVTGGSVAAQFVWDNRQEESPLERILNSEFTGERFDRFMVLNGGHGAWKQPNQYILFGLYADVLAGIITLDGFNEHYMIDASRRFELPANNFFQALERQDSRVTTAPLRMAALKLEADLYRFASRHTLFQFSNLAYLMVDIARTKLRAYASRTSTPSRSGEDDWIKVAYANMFTFNDKMTRSERKTWALDQYEKYVRLMHAGAEAMGIKSLFLIQPIPGWGKPLTPRETEFARNTNTKLYKEMTDHMSASRQKHGVPIYSLLDIFRDEQQEIYKDPIHINGLGNEMIAKRIADLIERDWGWPRKKVQPSSTDNKTPR